MSDLKTITQAVEERLDQLEAKRMRDQVANRLLKQQLRAECIEFADAVAKRLSDMYHIDLSELQIHVENAGTSHYGGSLAFNASIHDAGRELMRLHSAMTLHDVQRFAMYWKAHYARPHDMLQHITEDFVAALTFAYTGRTERFVEKEEELA